MKTLLNKQFWMLLAMIVGTAFMNPNSDSVSADDKVKVTGGGSGIYCPQTGYFFGEGDGTIGQSYFHGHISTEQTGDFSFNFENSGRGTKDEKFQEVIAIDGSSLTFRFQGVVDLIPLDFEGNFTGVWEGDWEVVRGTGRFRNTKGTLKVVAVNEPFNFFTDPKWAFEWDWEGILKIKKKASKHYLQLQTSGEGVFDPANIGLGDPDVFPFPFVIGDGSGLGVYDGTPTGNEFRLNGELVGDGFDQHFGTAQSLTTGILHNGRFFYPGETGPNPDGSGRHIHVMDTRAGEIWYRNNYYFELDPEAGTLTGYCDFRIIGGTGRFAQATGSVYCLVVTQLSEVTFEEGVQAPFHYDFNGFIDLRGK